MPESPCPAPRDAIARPSSSLPLAGLTLLAVEDSRYACDALRLMAQRAGGRLRRAETIADARRHLRVYRPDVVIIDPGLPDGDGLVLAAEIAADRRAPPVIVSGGAAGIEDAAMAAGAAACLPKPVAGMAAFLRAVCGCLPDRAWLLPLATLGAPARDDRPMPDPLALRDDLRAAARRLSQGPAEGERRYLAGFVAGVARSAGDAALAALAQRAAQAGHGALGDLQHAVTARLRHGTGGPLTLG
ncbi:MAG: response regulator [Paracoccaceae bacterium]|nr:MAG: response regulator [Paracoccaceae bacterium]